MLLELRRVGQKEGGPVGDAKRLAHVALITIRPVLVKVVERDAELFELDRLACGLADKAIPKCHHVCPGGIE